jgi:2-hydroxychromene-2-carboxylate isomerase
MADDDVTFFFGPGSRYSYLASTQLGRVSAQTGARFVWRPVLSLDLTARTGGVQRSPRDPAWRETDVSRWAKLYGVAYRDVAGEPDWAAFALACAAAQDIGGAEPFARALYAALYGEGRAPADVAGLATAAGLDGRRFAEALATSAATTYSANLEAALAAGAFGVPTFVTPDGAAFWCNDRLPLLVDHLKGLG